jgi:hypothetical protein
VAVLAVVELAVVELAVAELVVVEQLVVLRRLVDVGLELNIHHVTLLLH